MKSSGIPGLLVSVALAVSVACAGAPPAPSPTAPPPPAETPTVTATQPPATPAPPTPTALASPVPATPIARQGGTVSINALYFQTGRDGKFEGGMAPFKVTVAPKTDGGIRVSFSESEVGGQGDGVRAAGWTAAVMSALLLGVDPGRLAFTYDVSGRVDGPSAGALMTLGTLAAILGDEIPKDFAMTGTINPDGSVGPVGGIAHKIDGAVKAGIKTILVPVGQRTDLDRNTQQTVDVVRRGEEQGVTVRLVSNVYEAYPLATGKPLPQPKGGLRPELPPRVFDKLRAQTMAWLAHNSEHRARYESYSARVKRIWADEMKAADEWAERANNAIREGAAVVALDRAVSAVQYSLPTERAAQLYQTALHRGVSAAVSQAEASANARDAVRALFERLRAEQPKTASDALGLIDAYSNAVIAEVYMEKGDAAAAELVRNVSRMKDDDVLEALFALSHYYLNAEIAVEVTKTNLDVYLGHGTAPAPSADTLVGLAEMLRRAGEANMAAFDTVIVSEIARANGVRDEVVRERLADLDGGYALAVYLTGQMGVDPARTGLSRMQQTFYTLGGGLNVYALGTQLLSKYYSLDAQVDKDFRVTGYGREMALQSMLQLAEQRSNELLGVSKDVPISSLYYADNARVYRDGTARQKLTALFYYWQSSILSAVLANMTGEFGEKVRADLQATNRPVDFHRAHSFRP